MRLRSETPARVTSTTGALETFALDSISNDFISDSTLTGSSGQEVLCNRCQHRAQHYGSISAVILMPSGHYVRRHLCAGCISELQGVA
jgi:hypothetical protein